MKNRGYHTKSLPLDTPLNVATPPPISSDHDVDVLPYSSDSSYACSTIYAVTVLDTSYYMLYSRKVHLHTTLPVLPSWRHSR